MDLHVILSQVLGRRPDMQADARRVTLLIQKAAKRVLRETCILKTSAAIPLVANEYAEGPLGDYQRVAPSLPPEVGVTWEDGVTLKPVRWFSVTLRSAAGTIAPAVLEPMPMPIYDAWLLAKSRGKVMSAGTPLAFSDRMGLLCLAPKWTLGSYDTLVYQAAVEPIGAFTILPDQVDEAEQAILNLALSDVLAYPGAGANPNLAQEHLAEAMALCSRLYAKNVTGQIDGLDPFQVPNRPIPPI